MRLSAHRRAQVRRRRVQPLVVKNVDGLNASQGACGGCYPPDQAIATDLSYVMEGVNTSIGIFNANTGALQFGPYSADSFFAPIKQAGDLFSDPQMNYDVMHDRWIVRWLEISESDVPLPRHRGEPVELANAAHPRRTVRQFQFGKNLEPTVAAELLRLRHLGTDYWSLYVTCVKFRTAALSATRLCVFQKIPMMSGGTGTFYWLNDAVNISGGSANAFRLCPAIEEGVQDAEFFASTDAGYGVQLEHGHLRLDEHEQHSRSPNRYLPECESWRQLHRPIRCPPVRWTKQHRSWPRREAGLL